MDVSIIIVNYNTKDLLKNCLNSIYSHTKDINFEVIISDNGSTDGSIEMIKKDFPQVILIENNANLGFGAANNRGLKVATGKYIFYLNSDTVLLNNAVKIFFDYWEKADNKSSLGALGAPLLNENMEIIHSYGDFPNSKSNILDLMKMTIINIGLSFFYIFHISPERFRPKHNQKLFIGKVDYITGADLFMYNNDYAKFDERYFLYFEETDMQKKLAQNNYIREIINGPKIQHLCGGSVGEGFSIKRKASFSRINFEISRTIFQKKFYSSKISLFIIKLLITIIWINPFLFKNTKKYIKKIWAI